MLLNGDFFELLPPGDAPSYKEFSSTAQGAQALDKALYVTTVSEFIRAGGDLLLTTLLNRLRMGFITGDNVQFLNTRVDATPADAETQ